MSLILPTSFSVAVMSYKINLNSENDKTKQINYENRDIENNFKSIDYNHTNYFSFPSNLPSKFSDYEPFAQTNWSMLTQTNKGILGLSNDKQTIYFTSYSGQIIWAQCLINNALLSSFCLLNSVNQINLFVQEWVYLSNTSNSNWAAFLISDKSKQMIVTIDLDTGLFVPNNIDSDLVLEWNSVFKIVNNTTNMYTKLFQIDKNKLILMKEDSSESLTLIDYDLDNKEVIIKPISINFGNHNTKAIASFLYAGNKTFALAIDTNGNSKNNKTVYTQFLCSVIFSDNYSSLNVNELTALSNKYISTSETLDFTNFKNTFFYKNENGNIKLYFLNGSLLNNYIDVYDTNKQSVIASVSLNTYGINSITYNSNFNKLYIT